MSIPNEALQKLVQEIESQAISSQREISVVKGAVTIKQRDIRLLDLTTSEVKQLSKDTKIYEGVGKMFVFSPTAEVEKRLSSETAELKLDISNLNKKLNYLETTYRNTNCETCMKTTVYSHCKVLRSAHGAETEENHGETYLEEVKAMYMTSRRMALEFEAIFNEPPIITF